MKKDDTLFKTPSNLRVANQRSVMEAIRRRPSSCSELSESLNLSNPALKNITDELLKEGLILQFAPVSKEKKGRGRSKVLYEVNEGVGVFAAADLSGRNLSVCISDINNRILARDEVRNVLFIDKGVLQSVASKIEELLKKEAVKNRRLLGICISSPGKIDPQTSFFLAAPRFMDYRSLSLKDFFESRFHVPTEVRNDINMGLVGEARFGAIPKGAKNVYFAFVDIASGSSLMIDGDIYLGSNGYAGEMPNINPVDEESKACNDRFFTLTDLYLKIKELGKEESDPFYRKEVFELSEVIERYEQKDKVVLRALDYSAKMNALKLLFIANLLDPDCICLEGRIFDFGRPYFESILKYFRLYDANFNTASIILSSLSHDANLLGAVSTANDHYLLTRFAEMANKRTSREDYDLDEYFVKRV